MVIRHLYISSGHNYFGHHGRPSDDHVAVEVSEIECVAGHGIRGDRFFDYKPSYKGQITFFAEETHEALALEFGIELRSPALFRRNVITRGVDLNRLIGAEFDVQGVRLRGTEECRPCLWMDEASAPGAAQFLKGRGGLRAVIMTSGVIRSGQ